MARMTTICITLDDRALENLRDLGDDVVLTDNNSAIVRFWVKYAARKLLEKK